MLRRGIREYLRLRPRSREAIAAEVDEEIALHLELRTKELMARGLEPAAARSEAERRFGELHDARALLHHRAQERERAMSMKERLEGWRQDVAYSARALAREPVPAVVVILTLALGLGANATIFGIVDQLLLRGPAHVESPEQVRRVYVTQRAFDGSTGTSATVSYVTAGVLREATDVFESVAVYRYAQPGLGRGAESQPTWVGYATPELFGLLGVRPVLGRFFTAAEDQPHEAQRVAVVSYDFWQSYFDGTPDALGRTVVLGDETFTVIGVAPRDFTGPELRPVRVWIPFSTGYSPSPEWPTTWSTRWTHVLVRMRREVSPERADARATMLYRAAAASAGAAASAEADVRLLPPGYTLAGNEPPEVAVARWLAGVAIIVLLVACANVINVLLARSLRRRRELAVRLALGVSRGRLVRLLLSESLLLAVAGCLLALVIAAWGGALLRDALLPDTRWDPVLNTRVLVFSGALALLAGLLVGLVPALQASRQDVTAMLKASTAQGGLSRNRLRPVLTVMQTALALVLLVGAAHFVRSLWNVQRLDLGVDAGRVLGIWVTFRGLDDLPEELREAQRVRQRTFSREALERLRARPDVAAAALVGSSPMSGGMMTRSLRVPGYDSLPQLPGGGPFVSGVSDGYFETVGTRILRGRGIVASDGPDTEPVVVVSETMARTLWPDRDALGECLHIGGDDVPCSRVVGIAEDARRRALVEEPAMQYYVPLGQSGIGGSQLLVRPAGNTRAFIPELRATLHGMDPRLNYVTVDPLAKLLEGEVRPWRLGATMFLVFGALAVLIAAIGLYSIIAYGVLQRRTELGVRVALGARATAITAMILRQGLGLALLGIALGLPFALAGGAWIESLLFNTSTRDTGTYVAVASVLLGIALLASALPALRAARTSPLEAMRAE